MISGSTPEGPGLVLATDRSPLESLVARVLEVIERDYST